MSRTIKTFNRISPQFDRVNVEIINTCNLKCTFCPSGDTPKSVMSPDRFFEIATSLNGKAKELVLHILGEPLSHPDLGGILSAAADAQMPINVVTNGLLLHGDRLRLLLRPVVRQVSVSLQSYVDNFSDQDPTSYVKRVKAFADLALEERPDLYVNFRLWDLDEESSGPQVLARKSDSPREILRKVLADVFQFDWESVKIDIRRKKNHRLRGRQYLHFDSRFLWPSLDNDVIHTKGFCHALSGHFGIHADGTVVPCCLDHKGSINLGNVYATPIEEILASDRAIRMLDGFKKRVLVEDLCQRCGFISRFNRS